MRRAQASKKPGLGAAPSQRQLRVGELIRHALAEALARADVADPALDGVMVTVPEVRVSPDLKQASAYVIALGRDDQDAIVQALQRNVRFLRGEVARRVTLKHTPMLKFMRDTSFDASSTIDALLRSPRVARDLAGGSGDDGVSHGGDDRGDDGPQGGGSGGAG